MKNVLSHIIIQAVKILKVQLFLLKTLLADIIISLFSSFIPFEADEYFLFAFITFHNINPLFMQLPQLIPQRKPSMPQIMIPSKQLNFLAPR